MDIVSENIPIGCNEHLMWFGSINWFGCCTLWYAIILYYYSISTWLNADGMSTASKGIGLVKASPLLFIHSFQIFMWRLFKSTSILRGVLDYSFDTVSELTRRSTTGNCEWRTCPRSQAVARVGFEPATARTQGTDLTTEPQRSTTAGYGVRSL